MRRKSSGKSKSNGNGNAGVLRFAQDDGVEQATAEAGSLRERQERQGQRKGSLRG